MLPRRRRRSCVVCDASLLCLAVLVTLTPALNTRTPLTPPPHPAPHVQHSWVLPRPRLRPWLAFQQPTQRPRSSFPSWAYHVSSRTAAQHATSKQPEEAAAASSKQQAGAAAAAAAAAATNPNRPHQQKWETAGKTNKGVRRSSTSRPSPLSSTLVLVPSHPVAVVGQEGHRRRK